MTLIYRAAIRTKFKDGPLEMEVISAADHIAGLEANVRIWKARYDRLRSVYYWIFFVQCLVILGLLWWGGNR